MGKLVFVFVHNSLMYIKKMLESCKFIHKPQIRNL